MTKLPRSVAVVQGALDIKREEYRQISRTIRQLEEELQEARLAEAEANPHPWLGKKLKREVPASSYGRNRHSTKTIRGTLQVKQPGKYYRGSAAGIGELIVVTDSGLTAYSFPARSNESGEWELAS
jgi:hypothetical protein